MLIMILGGGQDEDENNIRHMLAIKRREKESDGEPIALQDINCDVIPGSVRTLVQTFIHALKERQCSEVSFIFYLDQQLGATIKKGKLFKMVKRGKKKSFIVPLMHSTFMYISVYMYVYVSILVMLENPTLLVFPSLHFPGRVWIEGGWVGGGALTEVIQKVSQGLTT
jgi:hypothetical protein